jgi:hypothetical protein
MMRRVLRLKAFHHNRCLSHSSPQEGSPIRSQSEILKRQKDLLQELDHKIHEFDLLVLYKIAAKRGLELKRCSISEANQEAKKLLRDLELR